VYYNNINIFKRARDRSGRVTTEKVSWHCAAEFDADEHQSISFIEDDSFIIFTKPTIRNGDRYLFLLVCSFWVGSKSSFNLFSWNFELRTIEPYGTLLYNIAPTATPDFIGLEIMENKLRLLVGKGSNAVELIPDRNVSDGLWHNISLFYSPTVIEVSLN
jgi:chondroitin sulfate proteoglycan 4